MLMVYPISVGWILHFVELMMSILACLNSNDCWYCIMFILVGLKPRFGLAEPPVSLKNLAVLLNEIH